MNLDDVILLRIFSYLPARDLASCSHVCKNWHRLVREELENNRARKRIETVLFESSNWDHSSSITKIDRAEFIRDWSLEASNIKTIPDFGIFTMNLPFNQCFIIEENAAKNSGESEENAAENSGELEENRRSKRRKHSNTTVKLLLEKLPTIVNILRRRSFNQVFIFGYGFIGTNFARTRTVEIENDSIDPSFSGILFPKSDLYRFEVRTLSPDDLKSVCDMRKLFELTEQTDESERLLWLILLTRSNRSLKLFSDKINPIQKEMDFACSGGLPDLVCQNPENGIDRKKQANQVSLIGLIGKKSHVNVSQIFIPDQVDFNQVWKAKSELLKSNQLDDFKSQFAFQISCCGRGKNYHNGVENHESSLLANLFPKLPIIGVFVNGELGHDYLPNLKDHNSDLSTFGFSSIFTIVSIKN